VLLIVGVARLASAAWAGPLVGVGVGVGSESDSVSVSDSDSLS